LLERPRRTRPKEAVSWVERTVRDSREAPLTDLEEKLIECIHSEEPDLALQALRSTVRLLQGSGDFLELNRGRLRRARLSAERYGGFRATSQFAELLKELPGEVPGN